MQKMNYLMLIAAVLVLVCCHPDERSQLNQNPQVRDIEPHEHGEVESSHTHGGEHKGCTCGHHAKTAAPPVDLIPVESGKDKQKCESCKKGEAHCTCNHKQAAQHTHTHSFVPKQHSQTCSSCGKDQCSCQSDTTNPSLLPPRSHTCKNCKDGNCDRCERSHPSSVNSEPIYRPANMRLA